jgi:cation-transporting ATPase E
MGKKKKLELTAVNKETGLTYEQVLERKELGLTNYTKQGSTKTIRRIIFSNIFTFFNMLNIFIASMLIYVGAYKDIFFIVIVTANTVIGIVQEIKAKRTIDKLSLLQAPVGIVFRDSREFEIDISEIVLNDILILKPGRQISADCIITEGIVEVDESLLTGESDSILKNVGDTLLSGSFVVSGVCKAEAVKIGKDAYVENLTKQAKVYKKPQSDLMKSLKIIVRIVGIFIIPVGATLFYFQYDGGVGNMPFDESVRATAGAVIGMIPSGLFLLTSLALAVGVLRLAQNNTLVQELYCIEMLARVDTLCLDKTGTITDGTMTVRSIIELEKNTKFAPKKIISEMMSAFKDRNQTSEALIEKFGLSTKEPNVTRLIPFSSKRKFSAVSLAKLGTFAIGAPEFVLSKKDYAEIKDQIENYAKQGLRILIYATSTKQITNDELPEMKASALILIEDTIRPDAILTIEYFKTHNVDVKVISGDNPATVAHIAARAGIDNAEKYISLEGLSDKEVIGSALKYQVFGRVNPHQKMLLVKELKANGRTVAMTGDGVNDILALREADTSIAMASGSEAARNVSHLVLMDSNFSSMPKVVNEGRRVINNVQRVATLFLTKTIFSIILVIIALLTRGRYPITPSQLFMIDFLVIGLPSFVLSLQPNHEQVKGKFLSNVLSKALPGALTVGVQTLIIMWLARPNILNLTTEARSTLIVISATFTSFIVLYRVLKPFNALKRILFVTMFIIFVVAVIFLPEFFEFNAISKYYLRLSGSDVITEMLPLPALLLLIVMLQSSSVLISFFIKLPGWIKKGFKGAIMKLSGV